MENLFLGKRQEIASAHDTLKHHGKRYAVRYVRLLPTVEAAYEILSGPYGKMPYAKKGEIVVKVDGKEVRGVYFICRETSKGDIGMAVKEINSKKEFQKKLLDAQA